MNENSRDKGPDLLGRISRWIILGLTLGALLTYNSFMYEAIGEAGFCSGLGEDFYSVLILFGLLINVANLYNLIVTRAFTRKKLPPHTKVIVGVTILVVIISILFYPLTMGFACD